ncbi:MAG: ABC transporter permease [Opitutales bacterium]
MSASPAKNSKASVLESAALAKPTSLWQDAWTRLFKNKAAVIGLVTFTVIAVFCLIGPFFTGYTERDGELALSNSAPMATVMKEVRIDGKRERIEYKSIEGFVRSSRLKPQVDGQHIADQVLANGSYSSGNSTYTLTDRKHLFGTDDQGRDLLTRIMTGGRISLMVGFLATSVSLLIGVFYGATAGYLGGRIDATMMRIVDILYALPFTIFVILLMVVFGRHIWLLFIAIGAVEWLTMARIVRGQVVAIKRQEYVEASKALGQKPRKIILKHVIPNVLGVVIIYSTLTVPSVIMLESFLSFLGLGIQPPSASWGTLIKEGAESMEVYPWLLLFPAGFFSATLLALNFLGDGLRDALDPKNSPR